MSQKSKKNKKEILPKDSLPEGITQEDLFKQYGKLVWCDFKDCFWNERPKGLKRTVGSILNNKYYKSLGTKDESWVGICGRPNEIAIRFQKRITTGGAKQEFPICFVPAKNGKTGHIDFAKLLQSDGTPYGGNLNSQAVHPEEHLNYDMDY